MTPHELEEAGEEAVERLQAPILRERAVRLTFAKMLRAHLAGYDQHQQLDNAAAAACEANKAHEAKEEEHVPGSSAEAQAAEAVARRLVAFEKRILSAQLQLLEADV